MKIKVNIQAIRIREWILVQVGNETRLGLKSTNFKPQILAGNCQLEKQIMMRTTMLQLKSPISP